MEFLPRRNIVVAAAVYVVIAAMFIDVVVAPDVTVDTVTFAPSADAVVAVTAAAADDLEANLTTESAAELIPDVQADTEAPDSQRASQVEAVTEATTTTTTTTTPSSLGAVSLGGGLLSNAIGGSTGGALGGFLSILGSPGTPKPEPEIPPGNFGAQLDTILTNLKVALRNNGFDPVNIGNVMQCRNCSLEGLSLVRRVGPSTLQYANRTLTVDAFLGFPAIYLHCFPCVQVVLMVPFTGMLEVGLWDMQIYGKISQRAEKGANPRLLEYKVLREGDLDMSLNGYGIMGPLMEVGFNLVFQRTISDVIRQLVYETVPNFIQNSLKDFSFPIGK